ncbi:Cardiolipin synthase (plasmid) [Mesomycoplasma hyorhinis]|uniref:Cardiolipin synthetase n=1 Tax=Mesomycoplasma hyorhinis (strain MCLD) TaxID=936139 RepID=A0ABM5M5Q0_MESHM|nr:cardiolipin synthetase [Mesomycoplasma hyorhinis MCLD]AEX14151.1 cardiolipin synthetase [Mesomycoplasma hyorhinis GDL-1]AHA41148.1 Cardiolipin synthetase [Mesomycoplasma hyorhinis DBS 1050]AOD25382.1 cardiolipin synthetase [Mesomycoplasma hyorhinis]VEU57903.1 Cardiolipin synthase [Mesomycoplasma hyorhinis]
MKKVKKFNFWILLYYVSLFLILALLSCLIYLSYLSFKNDFNLEAAIIIVFIYLTNLISNIYLAFQNRHFEAKIPWIIVFSVLPYIGQILYVIFGRRYFYRTTSKQYLKEYKNFTRLNKNQNDSFLEGLPSQQGQLLEFSRDIFNSPIHKFKTQLISDGHQFFQQIFQDIKNAQKFIFIDTYIIKNDFIWKQLKTLLIEKAKQGIKIRMILDSFGILRVNSKDWIELRKNKIQIIFYNKIFLPFFSANSFYRNHKKIYLIDGEKVYIGGNNISEEYAGFSVDYGYWMDVNLKIQGKMVQNFCYNFLFNWNNWSYSKKKKADLSICKVDFSKVENENSLVNEENIGTIIESGPVTNESIIEGLILKQIYFAKKKIQIFSPYFSPTHKIISALKQVILAGIKVEIYIPGRNDKKFIGIINSFFAKELQNEGAKVFFFKNIFFHGKSLIIDESIGIIGTLNFDTRSLYSQYEVNVFFTGQTIDSFLNYIDKYKKLEIIQRKKINKKYSWFIKMIILFFKPMI